MSIDGHNPSKQVVRITREEACDPHVDDMLNRQQSLRGEGGMTITRGGKWYYQNWIVFMVAGAISAFGAWALIEPLFDDQHYIQGEIERLDSLPMAPSYRQDGETYVLDLPGMTAIWIRGEKFWVYDGTQDLAPDGSRLPLSLDSLAVGQMVGVYVDIGDETAGLPICFTVVRHPPLDPPDKALRPLSELVARTSAGGLMLFPIVAGLIGLAVGGVDGIVCRLWRRAALGAAVGLIVGLLGAFVFTMIAGLVYGPINSLAMRQSGTSIGSLSALGFGLQIAGRGLAWSLAGLSMGIGQGIALRSRRVLLYGLLGGALGGLLGGLLFDPIGMVVIGADAPSSHVSRLIGIVVIGASVGGMIGLVERLTRNSWLRMLEGPLTGKEFLIFRDTMRLGSSPRSEIYLFNDSTVSEHHATIRSVADACEIERVRESDPVLVNNRAIVRVRLRHGDVIRLGKIAFQYQSRQG
jgi:hypothetical protein